MNDCESTGHFASAGGQGYLELPHHAEGCPTTKCKLVAGKRDTLIVSAGKYTTGTGNAVAFLRGHLG